MCVFARCGVYLYERWCVYIYIYIHSMRDVAVDLYAKWCVYIHRKVTEKVTEKITEHLTEK